MKRYALFILSIIVGMIDTPAFAHKIVINESEHGSIRCDYSEAEEGQRITLFVEPNSGFTLIDLKVYGIKDPEPTYSTNKVPNMKEGFFYTYNQIATYYSNKMMLYFGTPNDHYYYAIRLGSTLTLKHATKAFMDNTIWECSYLHSTPYRFIPAEKVQQEITPTCNNDNSFSFNMVNGDVIVNAEFAVNTIPVSSISLEKKEVDLIIDSTQTLSLNILPENATNKTVVWSSNDVSIAEVNSEGIVMAKKVGDAIISVSLVSDPEINDQCVIHVTQPASNISLSETELVLIQDKGTWQLTAVLSPTDATNKAILWSSDNTNVVEVDANGVVSAKKAGKAVITAMLASNPTVCTTCNVTVIQPVTGITLSQTKCRLTDIGKTVQLYATIQPDDATNKEVRWLSSNKAVCTVTNGNVVSTGFGSAVVMAISVDGEYLASCEVTVEEDDILATGIELSPISAVLLVGESLYLIPSLQPANATHKTLVWKSSDTSVASVTSEGMVTANSSGEAMIIVECEDNAKITNNCKVTVVSLGDVNCDGVVNIVDITSTVNYILGEKPTHFIEKAADVNGNNLIDPEDVISITKIIIGRD